MFWVRLSFTAKVHDTYLRIGLKQVQKGIRRGETGLVLLAGDVQPIEVMCHLPVLCEENDIPYVYVPCRRDLGNAVGLKKSCITVLIKEKHDYKVLFDEVKDEIKYIWDTNIKNNLILSLF